MTFWEFFKLWILCAATWEAGKFVGGILIGTVWKLTRHPE